MSAMAVHVISGSLTGGRRSWSRQCRPDLMSRDLSRDTAKRGFTRTRRLENYTPAMGYAPRALSRAELTGAGTGAKKSSTGGAFWKPNVSWHTATRRPPKSLRSLASPAPPNFSEFFHQLIGHSPIASRATVRRGSSEDGRGEMPGTGRPHR